MIDDEEVDDLLGPEAVVLTALPDATAIAELRPGEAELVARAVSKRQIEFATGRRLARRALARFAVPDSEILSADRAPIWPEGMCGSISHCDTRVLVAVAAARHGSVGVDVEHRGELERPLWHLVFLAEEIRELEQRYAAAVRGRVALLHFSVKEAFYKAQFPRSGVILDFFALRVEGVMDPSLPARGELRCVLARDAGPFARGFTVCARYRLDAFASGEIATAVCIAAESEPRS